MSHIIPLGNSLKGRERIRWRKIEENAFEGDKNYIPFPYGVKEEEEREYFVLVEGDKDIGRASTTIDRVWIRKRGENIGFIDEFAILPDYKKEADVLIKHCISNLKNKKMDKIFVRRSPLFPGLLCDPKEPPAFLMPYNPKFYIDIFLKEGFKVEKEWIETRMRLPTSLTDDIPPLFNDRKIKKLFFKSKNPNDFQNHKDDVLKILAKKNVPESVIKDVLKAYEFIKKNDSYFVRIDTLNIEEMKELSKFEQDIFLGMEHFGYNPRDFMGTGDVTFSKKMQLRFTNYLLKIKTIALRRSDNTLIGYVTYLGDLAAPMLKLKEKKGFLNFFRLLKYARSNDSYMVGGLGIDEDIRGLGAVRSLFSVILKIMADDGVRRLTTGPTLADNIPVQKTVEIIIDAYNLGADNINYVTLSYDLKG
ncbi:MAG: hypothetical protein EF806_02795 [Candidatus Methanoliparum thermophilum]|uniref:N-acetyltransferase domain-containing protein n=1 Tax=Methanoliparum thermophilum TaxID=2491083 RepID=A0A520KST7_METT2|nr:hypothetical protein [Candidatus Methanoliparum sp. LAM-1]RZN64987.1 MAG: hypothetical protein EF806_02795 [Candidatus Methanoliparum thermophilum]BDC36128.1 hypothetical protein MTLP_08100 [Candidatus Methanoliparum sp. LAM-1]